MCLPFFGQFSACHTLPLQPGLHTRPEPSVSAGVTAFLWSLWYFPILRQFHGPLLLVSLCSPPWNVPAALTALLRRPQTHSVLSQLGPPAPMSSVLHWIYLGPVTSFKAKLKCHLFFEPFPHHPASDEPSFLRCVACSTHVALGEGCLVHDEGPWLVVVCIPLVLTQHQVNIWWCWSAQFLNFLWMRLPPSNM